MWTEYILGRGAPNFITGMGGFLQAVLFGYGGVRIRKTRLDLHPVMPENSTSIDITGLDYRGNAIDISANTEQVSVVITAADTGAVPLYLVVPKLRLKERLYVERPVSFPNFKATIKAA